MIIPKKNVPIIRINLLKCVSNKSEDLSTITSGSPVRDGTSRLDGGKSEDLSAVTVGSK
jgi:hypothetical protein